MFRRLAPPPPRPPLPRSPRSPQQASATPRPPRQRISMQSLYHRLPFGNPLRFKSGENRFSYPFVRDPACSHHAAFGFVPPSQTLSRLEEYLLALIAIK